MLDVAYDFLKKKESVNFTTLFDHVAEEMKPLWKERFPTVLLKDIYQDKAAEFYTWLSIDGRFIRDNANNWSLIDRYTFDEVKKIRINIGEKVEAEEEA